MGSLLNPILTRLVPRTRIQYTKRTSSSGGHRQLLVHPLREDLEQIEVHLSLGDLDAEGVVVAIAGDVGLLLWHCLLGVCGAMGI